MSVEVTKELFPNRKRVVYQKTPLFEVVCQLRFPTILKIGASDPVEFQEKIRKQFPVFDIEHQTPPDMPPQVAEMLGVQVGAKVYRFRDESKKWTLSLANDFISLSTTKYTRWKEFRDKLDVPLNALRDFYQPSSFSRVGLRYIDAIVQEQLGLTESTLWSELLQPHILGELSIPEVAGSVTEAHRKLAFSDGRTGTGVLLNHGLQNVIFNETDCVAYMIDFDFFRADKTDTNDTEGVLDGFNEMASRAFQWCITEKLHNALQPAPIGD